mgnify:CR=1 FL=1
MEYETSFDYAGNLLNANSYLDDNLLTLSMSNASNYDFSDILNFSPLVDELQVNMLDIQANPQAEGHGS